MSFAELRFPYRPRLRRYLYLFIVSLGFVYVSVHSALHTTHGMVIEHLITLDAAQATRFQWFGAGFFALCAIVFAFILLKWSQVVDPILILGADAITLPRANGNEVIFYRDIQKFRTQRLRMHGREHGVMAWIHHTHGRDNIMRNYLPDDAAFDTICQAINQRIAH